MWRSKKLIIAAVLATVLVAGSIGGIVLAQENGDDSQPETLLARVAEILGIDQQKVEDAFAQAQSDMQTEALRNRLQNLVDQGKITQGEADQYLEWWQSKPDVPVGFGFRSHGGFRGMVGPYGWGGRYVPTE